VSVTRPSIALPARYRVVRHIASGGMAGVWEAHDEVLGRDVAVKVLAHHLNEDERARQRFQREARAAAGMSSHPHVVTIYDVGEHDGRSFIVMELMCCGSLADRLKEGPIPRQTALRWLGDAASALDAANKTGMVHRDIKPANLLLDERDRLAIADFGIARLAYDEQVTQTGQVLGTASYLAPEQAMGEPATDASDRYALAVVAFELLAGRRPFPHEHFAAQARAHVEEPPPDASEIDLSLPPATGKVLQRGLAKNPADRWPSAAALVDALTESLSGAAAPALQTEPTRRMAPIAMPVTSGSDPNVTNRRSAGAPGRPAAGRHRGFPVVAALVGLLFAAIVLAALLSGGGDGGNDKPVTGDKQKSSKPATKKKAATAPAAVTTPQQTTSPTPQAEQPDAGRAAELNAQGFGLMNAGRHSEAVAPLQGAYEACKGSDALDPCGFALFNYGRSLRLSGNPDQAVPVLEERIARFPDNQRGTVEQELQLAREGVTGDGRGKPGKFKRNRSDEDEGDD
jgi:tetratricopeptide (TPR) repeat protein